MRSLKWICLVCFLPIAAVTYADKPSVEAIVYPDLNKAILRNSLLHVEFSYQEELRLDAFDFLGRRFASQTSDTHPVETFAHGSRLQLYGQHPLLADEPLRLSSSLNASVGDIADASTAILRFESVGESSVSVRVEASLRWNESILDVTTTLTNYGEDSLVLYPVDEIRFNAQSEATDNPNLDFLLFTPMGEVVSATDDIAFHLGEPTPQYLLMDDIGVLLTRYQHQASRASFMRGSDWLAAQIRPSGACCAVGFNYLQGIENVVDNLIIFTSGENEAVDESSSTHVVGAQFVHGRLELSTEESFTYTQSWSGSFVPSPVVDVRNGVPFNERLEVLARFNNFYFFGTMGAPLEGHAAVELIAPDGSMVKREPLHVVNPFSTTGSGTYEVSASRPLYVSSQLSFGIPEDYDPDNFPAWIWEQTRWARLVVTDEQRRVLRVLDEAQEPWGIFRE